jgi:hypothetical protein
MRSQVAFVASILAFAAVTATAGTASAQRMVAVEGGGGDSVRFRGGVDLTGGGIFLNGVGVGLVGVDAQLGVQLNNLIGIYAEPHLVFGGGSYANATGLDGVVGATGMIDFTFDRIQVGAGAGFAYTGVNNFYASPEIEGKFAFYPVMSHGFRGRRRGLMIGANVHFIYWTVPGDALPLLEPMAFIGYQAF